jgi:LPXTG-motif cell wall-anchored protein
LNESIDQIMLVWSDAMHMIPALNPAYCNVGAGIAKSSDGSTYYILQAAYTSNKSCGEYKSPGGTTNQPGGSTNEGRVPGVSQLIVPVKIATADADGKIFHVVQAGQSFWAIAMTYKITIKDLETWNNLSRTSKLQIGQRLFIPGANTAGYGTPTPVGMILTSTPDKNGRIIHTVQSYQTLSTIADVYGIKVENILAMNGIKIDSPLQIGQKLILNTGHVTPSVTPRPLTPIEKLTPASDGKYYHIVKNGETLSWIANLYTVNLNDLMIWNGLTASSIIRPDQKLLLLVTPPASKTPLPIPATATLIEPTATTTSTIIPSQPPTEVVTTVEVPPSVLGTDQNWMITLGLGLAAIFLFIFIFRRKPK